MDTRPSATEQLNNIIEFRQAIYAQGLTRERDAQFELVDALLLSPVVEMFPALSQSPVFGQGWGSVYRALERGQQAEGWLRAYLSQRVPTDGVSVFALDPTVWPRPRTQTLAGLRYEQSPTQAVEGRSTVKGYAYSLLAWIPKRGKSWALPVDNRRLVGSQTFVEVGVEQVKTLCVNRPQAHLDVIVGDGSFGNHLFLGGVKDLPCAVVVRLRCDRVLYGEPGAYRGQGRPPVHGRRFAFKQPETWGPPDHDLWFCDSRYGLVHLPGWDTLHAIQDASTPFRVIRGPRCTWNGPNRLTRSGWQRWTHLSPPPITTGCGSTCASLSSQPSASARTACAGGCPASSSLTAATVGHSWSTSPAGNSGWLAAWWPTAPYPGRSLCLI